MRKRIGDLWVHSLFDTVQILALLAVIFKGDSMFSKDGCWIVLHGYLRELKRAATHSYGSNCTYTQSIARWYSKAVEFAGPPRPGSRGLGLSTISQQKLLRWVGMEESRGVDISA